MRLIGLKTAMLAAGLMLAGAGQAAPAAAPVAAPATNTAAPAPKATTTPAAATTPATAAPAATPTDPLLAQDGAPAITIDPNVGQPVAGHFGIQPQVTKNGERAQWFHDVPLFWTISSISIFVLILLLIVMIRFNRRANPVPSKTSHNTLIEIVWTAVPVLILVAIAIPSIGLLQAQYAPAPKNAITLKVTGNQWYWTYSYPDNGGFEIVSNMLKEKDEVTGTERARTDLDGPRLLAVDNRVVLPVGVPIRLQTTAADVIHSWAVPAFWIKLDAVPGRLNETTFTIEKPGIYFGQCSELCGQRHGYMPIAVQAVPLEVFNKWVVAKGGTPYNPNPKPAPAAAPAADNAATGNEMAPANMTEPDNAAGNGQ